jgi:hypothetical protein
LLALAIHPGRRRRTRGDLVSKEQRMRKLITTIAAALALAGVGLVTHTAASAAHGGAAVFNHILPYIEQDNLFKTMTHR